MTRTAYFLTTLSLLAASYPLGAAQPPTITKAGEGRLTILIEDMAGADRGLVDASVKTARQILGEAGVEAEWIVCSQGQDRPAACAARPGPWVLRLRLIPEEKARLLPLAANNFGVALPGKGGALGSLAYVFVERTERHARRIKVGGAILLGHMMAHELGHLLLGDGSHAASGIMTARFKQRHLQSAGQGGLRFFGKQRRAMREQIERRMAERPGVSAAD